MTTTEVPRNEEHLSIHDDEVVANETPATLEFYVGLGGPIPQKMPHVVLAGGSQKDTLFITRRVPATVVALQRNEHGLLTEVVLRDDTEAPPEDPPGWEPKPLGWKRERGIRSIWKALHFNALEQRVLLMSIVHDEMQFEVPAVDTGRSPSQPALQTDHKTGHIRDFAALYHRAQQMLALSGRYYFERREATIECALCAPLAFEWHKPNKSSWPPCRKCKDKKQIKTGELFWFRNAGGLSEIAYEKVRPILGRRLIFPAPVETVVRDVS